MAAARLDLQAFCDGFKTFRPVVTENAATQKLIAKEVRLLVKDARDEVGRMSGEEALAFLDGLVERLSRPEAFSELVNEDPTGVLASQEYGVSRMNLRIDRLLLQVAEAFHRGQPATSALERKDAYDRLQAKLRNIAHLREGMWRHCQIERGLVRDGGLYEDDGAKDGVRALIRVLLLLRTGNLHKRQNMVCSEVVTAEGYATGYFRPGKTIRDFVYAAGSLHTDRELFDLLYSNINTVVTHLTESESLLEFPPVRPARGWYSFRNGVYDCTSDVFFPYDSRTRPPVCTVHYVDQPFTACRESDWRDIRTPSITRILETQELKPAVVDWVWVLLGRALFGVKQLDRWEVVPFFQGVADSGKSTIVDGLFRYLFDQASTFIISNNLEQQFGLQDALGPASPFMVCCGSEIGKDFRLDQKQFQQMCSGERLSVAVKNGRAIQDVWTLPMVMSGNQAPSYVDDSGSIARRLAIVRFTVPLAAEQKDPQLFAKIGREMPEILQKMARAYKERVDNGDAKRDFWRVAGDAFAESRAELKAATNPLEELAQSGLLVFEPGSYMKLTDLRQAGGISPKQTLDGLRDVLQPRGVTFSVKAKRKLPGSDQACNTVWADGVRLATAADGE